MSPEISDVDSISTTSTAASVIQERYNLEGILAQSGEGDDATYLAKWEGYPVERSTWEAEENFDPETLQEWREKKARIEAGLEEEFDVDAHVEQVIKFEQDAADRKERRSKKRKRLARKRRHLKLAELNKLRALSEAESSSESSSEYDSDISSRALDDDFSDAPLPVQIPRKQRKITTVHNTKPPVKKVLGAKLTQATRHTHEVSSKASFIAPVAKPVTRYEGTIGISNHGHIAQKKGQLPQSFNYSGLTPARKVSSNKLAAAGSGPKGRPKIIAKPTNVLRSWDSRPKPRKSVRGGDIDPNRKPNENDKFYHQASKLWLRKKDARHEGDPDYTSLNLFDPKTFNQKADLNVAASRSNHSGNKPRTVLDILRAEQRSMQAHQASTHQEQSAPSVEAQYDSLFVDEPEELAPEDEHDTEMPDAPPSAHAEMRRESIPLLPTLPAPHTQKAVTEVSLDSAAEVSVPKQARPQASRKHSSTIEQRRKLSSNVRSPVTQEVNPTTKIASLLATVDPQTRSPPSTSIPPPRPDRTSSLSASNRLGGVVEHQGPKLTPIPVGVVRHPPPLMQFEDLIGDSSMRPNTNWKVGGEREKEDLSDVFATLVLPENQKSEASVIFRGLTKPVTDLLLALKKETNMMLTLEMMVSGIEWEKNFHQGGHNYYGAGHVLHNKRRCKPSKIDDIRSKLGSFGGVFQARWFTMLVYPAADEAWAPIDMLYSHAPQTPLRVVVRMKIEPFQFTVATNYHSAVSRPVEQMNTEFIDSLQKPVTEASPSPRVETASKSLHVQQQQPQSQPQSLGSSGNDQRDTMDLVSSLTSSNARKAFEYAFSCKMDDLLVLGGAMVMDTNPIKIFLHWPPESASERDIVAKWLEKIEGWDVKVYTSKEEWVMFYRGIVATGLILVHRSVPLNEIKKLQAILMGASCNIFRLNLNLGKGSGEQATITRISPVGCAFLLLDSLVINRPQQVSLLLSWYRHTVLVLKPRGTWTFVTRPRFRKFILSLIEENGKQSPGSEKPWQEMFYHYDLLAPLSDMDSGDEYATPLESAPYYSPYGIEGYDLEAGLGSKRNDKETIAANDNLLVQGFGKWSLHKVERHRKFAVLYDPNDPMLAAPQASYQGKKLIDLWAEKWQHVKIQAYRKFLDMNYVDRDEKRHSERRRARAHLAQDKEKENDKDKGKENDKEKGEEKEKEVGREDE